VCVASHPQTPLDDSQWYCLLLCVHPPSPPTCGNHVCVCLPLLQLTDITNLTAKINETLNPVMDQVDSALADIESANTSIRNSNVPQYIQQVDDGQVCAAQVAALLCVAFVACPTWFLSYYYKLKLGYPCIGATRVHGGWGWAFVQLTSPSEGAPDVRWWSRGVVALLPLAFFLAWIKLDGIHACWHVFAVGFAEQDRMNSSLVAFNIDDFNAKLTSIGSTSTSIDVTIS
jgi:hypothetical protein